MLGVLVQEDQSIHISEFCLHWSGVVEPTTTINRVTTTNLSPTSSHCPTFSSRL